MPGANLTRVEAQERASVVSVQHYDIELDITRGGKLFGSTTTIAFDAQAGSSTFLDLIADSVQSVVLNGQELNVNEVWADSRIELAQLNEHNTVTVTAMCVYSNTGEGLHRSVDPSDGNVYLYTQFEVPDARRVYAVFDQPDLKAVFDFRVIAPEGWEVISNGLVSNKNQLVGRTDEGTMTGGETRNRVMWTFTSTPPMSSYLTALVAGPYAVWRTTASNGDGRQVPMAIYCRKALQEAMAKDVDYLFDVTKAGFDFYNKTWGVPYPYDKYDQLFVPEYNAGAMENIGTVTIRDSYVFESKVTDALAERRVVTVLHELAHMWFGDLVTMKWWNDLWLNESFAEFTSTLATAEATNWKDAWATFTSGEKSWALNQDQLPTTHPIVAPIDDLNDTYVNFDGITYAKGASVLKQLVAYVGRERFFEGIHNYLVKHAYSNATLHDLLQELEATSGRDLSTWSSLWLEQAGITTLTADVATDEQGVITAFTIHQVAPQEHPVLRPHRLAVGFYNTNEVGAVVRTDRVELDVDGAATVVQELVGKPRPEFIALNDDDLTYAKLRFDEQSRHFALAHVQDFDSALTRAVIWLSLWDMTRDGELPAQEFVDATLHLLARETESTTYRYALSCMSFTAKHYVASAKRAEVLAHVAHELWALAGRAAAGSDVQFQLVGAYLGYGESGDSEFEATVRGLLDGSVVLDGLQIDNNLRWSLLTALARINAIDEDGIAAELAKKDTTENRQFALGARASRPVAEAKAWAWEEAIRNTELTNSQLEAVAAGFASAPADLANAYVERYFAEADGIWKNRTFHMAEALLEGLWPSNADAERLVEQGDAWLAAHEDADKALRRLVIGNVESARRIVAVRTFNDAL